MRKNDWIFMGLVLLIAGIWLGSRFFMADTETDYVRVTVGKKEYGTYSLKEDQVIEIEGTNQLEIRNGTADMIDADCPDKLCVHQKAVSRDGESIICLPNKVVVTVESTDERELDAVAN